VKGPVTALEEDTGIETEHPGVPPARGTTGRDPGYKEAMADLRLRESRSEVQWLISGREYSKPERAMAELGSSVSRSQRGNG